MNARITEPDALPIFPAAAPIVVPEDATHRAELGDFVGYCNTSNVKPVVEELIRRNGGGFPEIALLPERILGLTLTGLDRIRQLGTDESKDAYRLACLQLRAASAVLETPRAGVDAILATVERARIALLTISWHSPSVAR